MKRHCYWLQPIRSTIQNWIVTRHQYGISAPVSQTSFCGETSGDVAKCQLPSQAIRESSFNMTRGGDEDIETRNLKF